MYQPSLDPTQSVRYLYHATQNHTKDRSPSFSRPIFRPIYRGRSVDKELATYHGSHKCRTTMGGASQMQCNQIACDKRCTYSMRQESTDVPVMFPTANPPYGNECDGPCFNQQIRREVSTRRAFPVHRGARSVQSQRPPQCQDVHFFIKYDDSNLRCGKDRNSYNDPCEHIPSIEHISGKNADDLIPHNKEPFLKKYSRHSPLGIKEDSSDGDNEIDQVFSCSSLRSKGHKSGGNTTFDLPQEREHDNALSATWSIHDRPVYPTSRRPTTTSRPPRGEPRTDRSPRSIRQPERKEHEDASNDNIRRRMLLTNRRLKKKQLLWRRWRTWLKGSTTNAIRYPTWPETVVGSMKDWPLHSYPKHSIAMDKMALKFKDNKLMPLISKYLQTPPHRPATQYELSAMPLSIMDKKRLHQLLTDGTLEECTNPKGVAALKLLAESSKQRFRVLTDTLLANLLVEPCPELDDIQFTPLHNIQPGKGEFMVSLDWKAFYTQINLEPHIRDYFAVNINGKMYRMTHLPMGYGRAVPLAQLITRVITEEAIGDAKVKFDVYIDNVFLWGQKEEVLRVRDQILEITEEIQLTVGDMTEGFEVTHRGILFNSLEETKQMAPKFCKKLKTRFEFLEQHKTPVLVQSFVGMLAYMLYALQMFRGTKQQQFQNPLAPYYQGAHMFEIWEMITRVTQLATTICPIHSPGEPDMISFAASDASSNGIGWVLLDNEISVMAKRTYKQRHINELEAEAVFDVVAHCRENTKLRLSVDSKVVLYGILNSYSRSRNINDWMERIKRLAFSKNIILQPQYIATSLNPADEPSRNMIVSASKTKDWMYDMGIGKEMREKTIKWARKSAILA